MGACRYSCHVGRTAPTIALATVFGILFAPADGRATTWMPDQPLTDPSPATSQPAIAADSAGNVLVVWEQSNGLAWQLQYKLWDGTSWSAAQLLSSVSGTTQAVTSDRSGNFHVVWTGGGYDVSVPGLYYKKWDGTSWGPDFHLDGDSADIVCGKAIATDRSNRVHVTWWIRSPDNRVRLCYSNWNGMVWSAQHVIAEVINLEQYQVCLVCDEDGNVHVVWEEYDGDWRTINWTRFDGQSWLPTEQLSDPEWWGRDPTMAQTPDGGLHVAWQVPTGYGYYGIAYRHWDGSTWSPEEQLTGSYAGSIGPYPKLLSDAEGRLLLVWLEIQDGVCEIHHKYRDSLGWSYERRLTGEMASVNGEPEVAGDGLGRVHLVWMDDRGASVAAIYYKMRKGCLDGDEFAACQGYTTYPLFETRYSMDADGLADPPGTPIAFDSTRVVVDRGPNDRFFISGRPGVLANWVCDDKLFIDSVDAGVGFAGTADPALPLCRPIEDVLFAVGARDVTDYIPMGSNCVSFKLADTWREILGNTRMYLVRQDASAVDDRSGWAGGMEVQVFPNPLTRDGIIRVRATASGNYGVSVFSANGGLVCVLPDVGLVAGAEHDWTWQGIDRMGRAVSPGMYFLSVRSPSGTVAGKVLRLR
jgi:hypothetical protein